MTGLCGAALFLAVRSQSRAKAAQTSACTKAVDLATTEIDASRYDVARAALDSATGCPSTARRLGLLAESELGSGDVKTGTASAIGAVTADPDDPRAAYARAWAAALVGDLVVGTRFAQRAVETGRGTPARILLAQLLIKQSRYSQARDTVAPVLQTEPDNVRAIYELSRALKELPGGYHDAREGLVHILSLDPKFADARYQLAVLTYSRGALLEAQHHVDVFAEAFPNDPRIPELRQMLTKPPPHPAMTLGK